MIFKNICSLYFIFSIFNQPNGWHQPRGSLSRRRRDSLIRLLNAIFRLRKFSPLALSSYSFVDYSCRQESTTEFLLSAKCE
jgi:hypothetical protein